MTLLILLYNFDWNIDLNLITKIAFDNHGTYRCNDTSLLRCHLASSSFHTNLDNLNNTKNHLLFLMIYFQKYLNYQS